MPRARTWFFALLIPFGCAPTKMDPSVSVPVPEQRLGHADFAALLVRYVNVDGSVDYAAWHENPADVASLERCVTSLADNPPHRRPELFPDDAARLAYWLNLYNAAVIREIVRRWPYASTDDLTGGRLADVSLDVGGRSMRLIDIEAKVIRVRFSDPRALLAISCGTRSCPLLPKSPFEGTSLDARLEQAARSFVNATDNVLIDDDRKEVVVSPILGWYERDFIALVKQRSAHPAPTILEFVDLYAEPALVAAVARAREGRYHIVFKHFDWRIHGVGEPPPAAAPASSGSFVASGEPLPELELATVDGGRFNTKDARGKVLLIDFWATWCKPCLWSFPRYAELQLAHGQSGLAIVAIAEDEAPEPVIAFANDNHIAITLALDPRRQAARPPLSVSTLPTVLLVDRAGAIRYRHEGYEPASFDALVSELESLLDEPSTDTGD